MIRRFYAHNFRCLENFDLPISGLSSVLLIGKNGAGKSTIGYALEIFQKIARGTNRVKDLIEPKDFTRGRRDIPMRFEIELELSGKIFQYILALELPEGFKELRVFEESVLVGGKPLYTRKEAQVTLAKTSQDKEAKFLIDWHLVALPIVQEQSEHDPLYILKQWLARMLILQPIPALIKGESSGETLHPNRPTTNFGDWFAGLIAHTPAAYAVIDRYLKKVMPDFKDLKNPVIGRDVRSLTVQFSTPLGSLNVPFEDLSDGEKSFIVWATALAANESYGPVLCFWDEPDSHVALSEIQHFIMDLRRNSREFKSQIIVTSHNPEAIRGFSEENTLYLYRKSHLEPTLVRSLNQISVNGDLIETLTRGDLEP